MNALNGRASSLVLVGAAALFASGVAAFPGTQDGPPEIDPPIANHAILSASVPTAIIWGHGTLSEGRAVVDLPPDGWRAGNTECCYHAILTPTGDCEGVVAVLDVANSKLRVKELDGGKSNASFAWMIVATPPPTQE